MAITFVRIDNRLIHGQVVQSWLPSIKTRSIIVVSDEAASSSLMGKMMQMALPEGYLLKVLNVEDSSKYLKEETEQKDFILLESFNDLKKLADTGVPFSVVNVGNTKYEEGKKEYGRGVFLNEADIDIVKNLMAKGVKFDVRALPSSMSARII